MPNRRPQLQLIAPSASAEEAAASWRRSSASCGPPRRSSPAAPEGPDAGTGAALLEGVARAESGDELRPLDKYLKAARL